MRLSAKAHAIRLTLLAATVAASALPALADVHLPAIFGDHMVLQQQQVLPIWGTADPGEKITVTLSNATAKTVANEHGAWRVELRAQKPNSVATTLVITGKNTLTFTDVLLGEVWLASGQSNMEFGVRNTHDSAAVLAAADRPLIRLFAVPHATPLEPQSSFAPRPAADLDGHWVVCTADALRKTGNGSSFSAVAYFFARDLQAFTHGAVGIIESSWGGTSAESWTPAATLAANPKFAKTYAQYQKLVESYPTALAAQPEKLEQYKLARADFDHNVRPKNDALNKEWQAAAAKAREAGQPIPPKPQLAPMPVAPDPTGGPHSPTVLYNGMIAPLQPFAIKGVIWYQGESNGGNGLGYRDIFPAMITAWRAGWGEGDFPFLYVQLPGYGEKNQWAMLREAQLMTLSLPHTGMAVAIDLGAMEQLHPIWKEPIGQRLALVAEQQVYGSRAESSGPRYTHADFQSGKAVVHFDHAKGLQISSYPISGEGYTPVPTDKLHGFALAGDDHIFHDADAVISGETVTVSSPDVPHPIAVRYGWNPVYPVCNLYNAASLPASPFRSDDWAK
jgi:sialate O-acetylesterase